MPSDASLTPPPTSLGALPRLPKPPRGRRSWRAWRGGPRRAASPLGPFNLRYQDPTQDSRRQQPPTVLTNRNQSAGASACSEPRWPGCICRNVGASRQWMDFGLGLSVSARDSVCVSALPASWRHVVLAARGFSAGYRSAAPARPPNTPSQPPESAMLLDTRIPADAEAGVAHASLQAKPAEVEQFVTHQIEQRMQQRTQRMNNATRHAMDAEIVPICSKQV